MADRILAQYEHEDALAAAIHQLHARGYRALDAYLPFPAIEVEDALTGSSLARPSRLPYLCFLFGVLAAGTAYALQWLLNGYLYPLVVGGRPPHFPLAFVPITFEMGVLFAWTSWCPGTAARDSGRNDTSSGIAASPGR